MNTIWIAPKQKFSTQLNVYNIDFDVADKFLQILRADFFNKINIHLPLNIQDRNLKFMMHLNRVLAKKGIVQILNSEAAQSTQKFTNLIIKLGFFAIQGQKKIGLFSKTKPQVQKQQTKKLAIGFESMKDQQIDEDDLMKNEKLSIKKQKTQNCAQKVKTCANCNCGRKDAPKLQLSKQELVKAVNEGKPQSGCGKCYLGDSFRCGTCPYKGMPAFKPGDKLRLQEEGNIVVVQNGTIKLDAGKVKIQL